MKIHLLLLPLLLVTSCMKQSEESNKDIVSGRSLSMEQVQAAEIDTINKKMNNDPQYQLAQNEYETLLASGLLSESEKEELKDLFH
ncbi:MAG: hypothetical protein NDI69_17895 [Bacteriovoracaceae bacterium]|nr:hypothetical protein [Bacteriovoracaceae bacterium]